MRRAPSLQLLKEVIEQQLSERGEAGPVAGGPAVTMSRATGCGALRIALDLAQELEHRDPRGRAWTVLDREQLQRVVEDPQVPKQLARIYAVEAIAGSRGEGPLGTNPFASPLPRATTETVRRLCWLGRVIIVDRAACLMAADLERTLHIRLVGSYARRVDRVMRELHMGYREAQSYVEEADAARARYLRERMGMSIENTLYYHMVINTDRVGDDAVVQTIARSVELMELVGEPRRRRPTTTRPQNRGAAA